MGALRAVDMLNGSSYRSIFFSKTISSPEVLIAYKLFFQLLDNQPIVQTEDEQVFFNKVCDYLTKKNPEGKICIYYDF